MQKLKTIILLALFTGILLPMYAQENSALQHIYENSRKDVIVTKTFTGFQTKITQVSDKHIHYILYKTKGREKEKKIKQNKVAFTLAFNNTAKQGTYPLQMEVKEFLSLPIYLGMGNSWVVYGTSTMTNMPFLQSSHPDIYNDYIKGRKEFAIGSGLCSISYLTGLIILIPGGILMSTGEKKLENAVEAYYNNFLDLEVCTKYGITITPYKTSLNFNKKINYQ